MAFRAVAQCPRCGQVFGVIGETAMMTDDAGNIHTANGQMYSSAQQPMSQQQQPQQAPQGSITQRIRQQFNGPLVHKLRMLIAVVGLIGVTTFFLYFGLVK